MHQKQNNGNTVFHCDLFYAFKLTKKGKERIEGNSILGNDPIKDIKWVDDSDLMANPNIKYKDLIIVYDEFKKLYQRVNIPTLITHFCNFSARRKTLLLRLTNNCNLRCPYCLLGSDLNGLSNGNETIEINKIENLVQNIQSKEIKKIVITGGEPFMVTNLVDIVNILSNHCESVSICTNGTILPDKNVLENLISRPQLKKIVISLDACNESDYKKIVNADKFFKVKEFINTLNEVNNNNQIEMRINVVAQNLSAINSTAVNFWKMNSIRQVSISYPMQDTNEYARQQLFDLCNSICKGEHGSVDFLEKFELHLPECKNRCFDEQNRNLISAYRNNEGDFQLLETCLDKGKYGNS